MLSERRSVFISDGTAEKSVRATQYYLYTANINTGDIMRMACMDFPEITYQKSQVAFFPA
jgi:hypothetical protein